MIKNIKLISIISLFITPLVFADQEEAAMHAQDMANTLQQEADAADEASLYADMRALEAPTFNNMNNAWNQWNTAMAAQNAANSAQEMADALNAGY